MVRQWTEGFRKSHMDKTGWKQALKKTFSLQGANKSGRDKKIKKKTNKTKKQPGSFHTTQPSTGYVNKEQSLKIIFKAKKEMITTTNIMGSRSYHYYKNEKLSHVK